MVAKLLADVGSNLIQAVATKAGEELAGKAIKKAGELANKVKKTVNECKEDDTCQRAANLIKKASTSELRGNTVTIKQLKERVELWGEAFEATLSAAKKILNRDEHTKQTERPLQENKHQSAPQAKPAATTEGQSTSSKAPSETEKARCSWGPHPWLSPGQDCPRCGWKSDTVEYSAYRIGQGEHLRKLEKLEKSKRNS